MYILWFVNIVNRNYDLRLYHCPFHTSKNIKNTLLNFTMHVGPGTTAFFWFHCFLTQRHCTIRLYCLKGSKSSLCVCMICRCFMGEENFYLNGKFQIFVSISTLSEQQEMLSTKTFCFKLTAAGRIWPCTLPILTILLGFSIWSKIMFRSKWLIAAERLQMLQLRRNLVYNTSLIGIRRLIGTRAARKSIFLPVRRT